MFIFLGKLQSNESPEPIPRLLLLIWKQPFHKTYYYYTYVHCLYSIYMGKYAQHARIYAIYN